MRIPQLHAARTRFLGEHEGSVFQVDDEEQMSQYDNKLWAAARCARDKLIAQFIEHPDVTLIGIGHRTRQKSPEEEIVIRVHVRDSWFTAEPTERAQIPSMIDGIRVMVIPGDYASE